MPVTLRLVAAANWDGRRTVSTVRVAVIVDTNSNSKHFPLTACTLQYQDDVSCKVVSR